MNSESRCVTVVGGGLAGMVTALHLQENGFTVEILERGAALGGKAGSQLLSGRLEDHGYHIFPMWYYNLWALIRRLRVEDNFVDINAIHQLCEGDYPKVRTLSGLPSLKTFLRNIRSQFMPTSQMLLLYYLVLDLASQLYRQRAVLDRLSFNGFVRSRFYKTELLANQSQEMILQAISAPSYQVSSMTVQVLLRYWLANPSPMYRIARASLQESLIDPIAKQLSRSGCLIRLNEELVGIRVEQDQVVSIEIRNEAGAMLTERSDIIVLAVPVESLLSLVNDETFNQLPELAALRMLTSRPMASLVIYTRNRIPGLPMGHVTLSSSRYALSLIDVAPLWKTTHCNALNVIISNFLPLKGLSEDAATREVMRELRRFIPGLSEDNIERTHLQMHYGEQLLMNDVGAWEFRPKVKTRVGNLYLAGDYCQSHIDLVCMEGAVATGIMAAKAICEVNGVKNSISCKIPRRFPHWISVTAKIALFPFALVTWLYVKVAGVGEPDQTDNPDMNLMRG